MEASFKTDNSEKHGNEFDSVFKCAKTTQTDNKTEPSSISPVSHVTSTPCVNPNSLYDALPVSDTVIGNLDLVSTNLTSNEVAQHYCSETMSDNKSQNIQSPTKEENDNQTSSALSQLLDYGMSDSEDSHSDSEESLSVSDCHSDNEGNNSSPPNNGDGDKVPNSTNFRENVSSSESSSEYDSDSSSSYSNIGACGGTPAPENKRTPEKMAPPRTKGEIGLQDLPPIEELKISVSEEDCVKVGIVTSIIDQLVIVQSIRGSPTCDIDTLFFLNRGKNPLGRVFDVLGPVAEPLYAIRFNSYEQALETGVKTGTPVFCAPRTQHTSLVFVSELMKMKGSDASWEHNNEPPEVFLDYSDDEEERKARRSRRKPHVTEANKSNSLERIKKFEKQMNDKNLLITERYKNQQNQAARNKKKPVENPRLPIPGPNMGPPPPPPWLLRNPAVPMPRPEFWQPQPYQFAYPPYGALMYPPRQQFMAGPMLGPAPPPPTVFHAPQPFNQSTAYNPAVPPPHVLRPQPMSYFPKPRHPPWAPPPLNLGVGVSVGVMQPPTHYNGNPSSYTQ